MRNYSHYCTRVYGGNDCLCRFLDKLRIYFEAQVVAVIGRSDTITDVIYFYYRSISTNPNDKPRMEET